MTQLPTFQISDDTRLGRMLAAGRLTATMHSKATEVHMTLSFSAKAKIENKWKTVPFSGATHVFIQQGPGGWGSAKVGTYYPKTGKLYTERSFDTKPWLYAIAHIFLAAQTGAQETAQYEIMEANRCGKCGKELTDPVSIERGIGPTCIGLETGSQHYHKGLEREFEPAPPPLPGTTPPKLDNHNHNNLIAQEGCDCNTTKLFDVNGGMPCDDCGKPLWGGPLAHLPEDQEWHDAAVAAKTDKKGRVLPKTFDELAAVVKQ